MRHSRQTARWAMVMAFCVSTAAICRAEGPTPPAKMERGSQQNASAGFRTDIPAYTGNVVLGRPTDHSITASVLLFKAARVRIACGRRGEPLTGRAEVFDLGAGEPREILLDGLEKDTAYEYRVLDAENGAAILPAEGNGSFHTCRSQGVEFSFTVQADSHLDELADPDLYRRELGNVLAEAPDFHIDLGDTFMTDKHASRESAGLQYAAQRYWLGLAGGSAPIFLVLGNHDGEEAFRPGTSKADGLAVWANAQRKRLFPNPIPSAFYGGNEAVNQFTGLLQDYYAWEWGDALFVVLDPYWYSASNRGGREPWNMTLGKAQYDWLSRTLRTSKASFKFLFIHQLVGGLDANGRGGVEAASLYEWGGRDIEGKDEFATRRAGWEMPIHQLLVETGVQVVFHGHDHFFAHQTLDGVVYQLVPQPAHPGGGKFQPREYGYVQGDLLTSSGHLLVRVGPQGANVQYVVTAKDAIPRVQFTYGCEPHGR